MKPHTVNYNPQSFTLEEFRRIFKEIWDKERRPTTYDIQSDAVKREIDKIMKEEIAKGVIKVMKK